MVHAQEGSLIISISSILWCRLDEAGHEASRLSEQPATWQLEGAAVFVSDGLPCRLDYQITTDRQWVTQEATVRGWVGARTIDLAVGVDHERRWSLNGSVAPAVQDCIDLDLNFSPATNLLPIRRLELGDGQAAALRAS